MQEGVEGHRHKAQHQLQNDHDQQRHFGRQPLECPQQAHARAIQHGDVGTDGGKDQHQKRHQAKAERGQG
ncbi:hypothetical protein D3C78_1890620 [compost metagenome]